MKTRFRRWLKTFLGIPKLESASAAHTVQIQTLEAVNNLRNSGEFKVSAKRVDWKSHASQTSKKTWLILHNVQPGGRLDDAVNNIALNPERERL